MLDLSELLVFIPGVEMYYRILNLFVLAVIVVFIAEKNSHEWIINITCLYVLYIFLFNDEVFAYNLDTGLSIDEYSMLYNTSSFVAIGCFRASAYGGTIFWRIIRNWLQKNPRYFLKILFFCLKHSGWPRQN